MSDFWGSLLRLEGFWNSPLRVEILRVVATGAFFILGVVAGRLWAMWRRYRQKKTAERGVSEDVVTIEKILLERRDDGTRVMRIRIVRPRPDRDGFSQSGGPRRISDEIGRDNGGPSAGVDGWKDGFVPASGACDLGLRATAGAGVPPRRLGDGAGLRARALYIGGHFLSTVLLIRRDDLLRFRDWDDCAAIEVEHASHGERILTLMNMAAEYERQEAEIASRRAAGRRANYEETMYILDLGLDTQCADLPSKSVPWKRFESTLEKLEIKLKEPAHAVA